ncbi:hypothetical protein ACFLV6_00400 [Chloroflexota bacterium]
MNELSSFIDAVYREPYSLLRNNCIKKSLKIKTKAEELEKRADLICCVSIVPMKKWHNLPTVNPHVYTEIEGKKIDVSLDPGHENIYCKNSEKRLILPVNISRLRKTLSKGASHKSFVGVRFGEEKHGY